MRTTEARPRSARWIYAALTAIAVTTGAALVATGLVAGSTPEAARAASAQPALGVIPMVHSAAAISYPLGKYGPSDSQMSAIMKARRIFEVRCMHRLGFAGNTFADLLTTSFNETAKGQILTFLDPASARRNGYHASSDRQLTADTALRPSRQSIAADNLQAAVIEGHVKAVHGHAVPVGGCRDEGLRSLEKGTSGNLPIDPRFLMFESQVKAISDPRLKETIAAWRSCLKARGYSYATPFQAENTTAGRRGIDGYFHTNPTALERSTATADATCRVKVNLLGMWVATESAYQNQLIVHYRLKLNLDRKIIRVWLRNAEAALALGH
jgi:hypothetical protein